MKRKRLQLALILCVLLGTVGCGTQAAKAPIPGSVNQFDSDTYLALVTAYNVIEGTKSALANNQFPVSIAGNVKTALNDLVKAYNAADASYQFYHSAALAGTATPAQQTTVSGNMAQVQFSTTNLTTVKGGH
jgi:hypothetical protein